MILARFVERQYSGLYKQSLQVLIFSIYPILCCCYVADCLEQAERGVKRKRVLGRMKTVDYFFECGGAIWPIVMKNLKVLKRQPLATGAMGSMLLNSLTL